MMPYILFLIFSIIVAGLSFRKYVKHLNGNIKRLQDDNNKLSGYLIESQVDKNLLLPECNENQIEQKINKNQVDVLLDEIENSNIISINSIPHNPKNDDMTHGFNSIVCLNFAGGISLRDSVFDSSGWIVDMVYKGNLLPSLTQEQQDRARRIFRSKFAGKAVEDLIKERDDVCKIRE